LSTARHAPTADWTAFTAQFQWEKGDCKSSYLISLCPDCFELREGLVERRKCCDDSYVFSAHALNNSAFFPCFLSKISKILLTYHPLSRRFANSNAETILENLISERQPARIEIDLSDCSEEEPRRWIHQNNKFPPYPQAAHSHNKGTTLDATNEAHFICKLPLILIGEFCN
jgi:hypothetical protein